MDEFELFKQREADYASEFEKRAKEYFSQLAWNSDQIHQLKIPSHEEPYREGYFAIMDKAYESLNCFFEDDTLHKDYPQKLKEMRNTYHQMYLALKKQKKIEDTRFNDGQLRAARDLDKGLDGVIQNAAEFGLNQLQKHQQQRMSARR